MSIFCLQKPFKIHGLHGIISKFIQDVLSFKLKRHNI